MKKVIKILITILIVSVVYQVISYTSKSYRLLNTSDIELEEFIKHGFLDSVQITIALCNKTDTLFHLNNNNYGLLVWNVKNYSSISKKKAHINLNKKNRDFYFTPYTEQYISPGLTIKYKIPDYIVESVSLNLAMKSEIYDSFDYKQYMGYSFKTSKFGIGHDKKRSSIIFDFNEEEREVIFMFYNKKSISYLLVYYSINNEKINRDILFSMLR